MKEIENFQREYQSLKDLTHPSIIRYIDFQHEPSVKHALLYMEWVSTKLATSPGSTDSDSAIDLGDVISHHSSDVSGSKKSYIAEAFIWHVLFHLGAALSLCHHGIELNRELSTEHITSAEILAKLGDNPPGNLRQLANKHSSLTWSTERVRFSVRANHRVVLHRDIKPKNGMFCRQTGS